MSVKKYGWVIQKRLFAWTNEDSALSHTHENSKVFNVISKYVSFFNNKTTCKLSRACKKEYFYKLGVLKLYFHGLK